MIQTNCLYTYIWNLMILEVFWIGKKRKRTNSGYPANAMHYDQIYAY